METTRSARPSLSRLHIPQRQKSAFATDDLLDINDKKLNPSLAAVTGGFLTPDIQPSNTPPTFPSESETPSKSVQKIGQYLLSKPSEAGPSLVHNAFHTTTEQQYTCKVIPVNKYSSILSAYFRCGSHDHINDLVEVIKGQQFAYLFFEKSYGDLHSFVRQRRKLKEADARRIFTQVVSAVQHCHERGIILRDLKLRKFVFKDPQQTVLQLEGLEDALVLDDESDDGLSDKHGCPAYVSPEILHPPSRPYSGRAADIWGLGVMLYTLLCGRYPFHHPDPASLFNKIRHGQYVLPEGLSARSKCLIRALLRKKPEERLLADEISRHPWFTATSVRAIAAKLQMNGHSISSVTHFSRLLNAPSQGADNVPSSTIAGMTEIPAQSSLATTVPNSSAGANNPASSQKVDQLVPQIAAAPQQLYPLLL